METKKEKIKELVKEMLIESHNKAMQNIDRVLNSGCIDIDSWDEKIAPMILPKAILTAILENEAIQYTAKGTIFDRKIKKEVKNIKYFL